MGEFELLARIRERLPAIGPRIHLGSGDDAAITLPGGATATSVDALVEGVHFRRDLAAPAQIGHKALATALSDLAAMGAAAGEAYVVLGLPAGFDEDECVELLDGMAALAERTGTALAGGDLSRAGELFLAVTVVGHAPTPQSLVRRRGAKPGDVVVLSGEIGGAAAGLELLMRPTLGEGLEAGEVGGLRGRQLEPLPRLGAGRALAEAGARAMIDLSDGLGGDAAHIARGSDVKLEITAEAVPLAAGSRRVFEAADRDPWQLLGGGEDYELLATLPPERLADARQLVGETETGLALTEIGKVVPGVGVEIRLPGGGCVSPAGFDQLA
jgi:thiamine-monophosphate kinase